MQVKELIEKLKEATLIVGFNIINFDYRVLQPYTDFNLNTLKTYDILAEVYKKLRYRISLQNFAEATLDTGKSADGLKAVQWFREGKIEEVKKLATDLGVDELKFKTAQVYDYQHGNPLIPDNETFARYRKNSKDEFELKNKMRNHCWRMWSSAVITWDGGVVPCCFDKDAKHQLGDVNTASFDTIWSSKRYKRLRKQILTARQEVDICKNCSEGSKVWV
jgi:radical SAM protein with 4Fe4S-binding SPASM domain